MGVNLIIELSKILGDIQFYESEKAQLTDTHVRQIEGKATQEAVTETLNRIHKVNNMLGTLRTNEGGKKDQINEDKDARKALGEVGKG